MVKKSITIFCVVVFSSSLLALAGHGVSKEVMRLPNASLNSDLDAAHKQSIRALVLLACTALGNKATVEHMLKSGHVDRECLVNGWSAVTVAIAQDQHDILQTLLERGYDPSMTDDYGRTPVFIAVRYARKTCLTLLHSFGFDMNASDDEGRTPLMWVVLKAPEGSKKEMINRLIQNGADPNRVDNTGFSALGLAIAHGYEDVACYLMRKQVCLQHGGKGPCSCKNGHPKSVGSDWTLLASHQELVPCSLLMLALEKSLSNEFVRELLNLRVPADENPEPGMHTPLTTAVRLINTEAVLLLLKYGASVNRACNTEDVMTPLMYAAQGGNEGLVKMLLDKGADRSLRSRNNRTAYDFARTSTIQKLVELVAEPDDSDCKIDVRDSEEQDWLEAHVARDNSDSSPNPESQKPDSLPTSTMLAPLSESGAEDTEDVALP